MMSTNSAANIWTEVDATHRYCNPLQEFLIQFAEGTQSGTFTIDYETMVWNTSFSKDEEEAVSQSRGLMKVASGVLIDGNDKEYAGSPFTSPVMDGKDFDVEPSNER